MGAASAVNLVDTLGQESYEGCFQQNLVSSSFAERAQSRGFLMMSLPYEAFECETLDSLLWVVGCRCLFIGDAFYLRDYPLRVYGRF